jgi:hypothetical protein
LTLAHAAGVLLIALPVALNLFFTLLGRTFAYPDILRQPTEEILRRFQAGGTALRLTWHGFAFTAVGFAPAAVLVGQVLAPDHLAYMPAATAIGVLAAAVQFLGLIRWPYLVPFLARAYFDPDATSATRAAVDVTFQAFHRTLGVAIGEHLGYLFTGLWTLLVGIAMTQSDTFSPWLGWPGVGIGVALLIGSFEFAGPFEESGWSLAGKLIPVAYALWSIWLLATGILLILT